MDPVCLIVTLRYFYLLRVERLPMCEYLEAQKLCLPLLCFTLFFEKGSLSDSGAHKLAYPEAAPSTQCKGMIGA